jgi:hypothetical protein
MPHSSISLNVKNKIEKSTIVKLSDIDYVKILSFNIKYYMFKNLFKMIFL